jgi:hypothetical protein
MSKQQIDIGFGEGLKNIKSANILGLLIFDDSKCVQSTPGGPLDRFRARFSLNLGQTRT